MTTPNRQLTPFRILVLFLCLVVIGICWWQVLSATDGLTVRYLEENGVPLRFLVAEEVDSVPGVIIAHGFSGSQQLMLGFSIPLARAGYGVILLDFDGHGANRTPMNRSGSSLQGNLNAAYAALIAQPEVAAAQVGLLGHSMGSGAVMTAGVTDGDRYQATIAVSPTDAAVTPDSPNNFLLMAGSLEPPFVANAEDLLARAGGSNSDLAARKTRALRIIPYTEHISILFRWLSHDTALDWLNLVFGVRRLSEYRDVRIGWYGLHLAAWLVALLTAAPLIPIFAPLPEKGRRTTWVWLGLVVGSMVGTAVLALISQFIPMVALGGLAVGGALAAWFMIVGTTWLLSGFHPLLPSIRSLVWALIVFAFLWVAFGVLAQWVWLPWFMQSVRLWRWPVLVLAFLPFFLAAGMAQQGTGWGKRVVWWLAESAILVVSLFGLVLLTSDLFFIVLVVPLLPLILGMLVLVGKVVDDAWAYGLGSAMFFAWLILSVFPLVG